MINNLPTPYQIITDSITVIILGFYGILMIWEGLFPARKLPEIKYWKFKGLIAFIIFFLLIYQ